MTSHPELAAATWRKSSYSNGGDANCIEVAQNIPGLLPIRDSKDPQGPALLFPAHAFAAFLAGVKAGRFGAL